MAEKNSHFPSDDYTRRLAILEPEKREAFMAKYGLTKGTLYKMLAPARYKQRYVKKRELQDKARFDAWKNFGAVFETITYSRV